MRENFKNQIAASPYIFTIGVAGDSGSGKTTFTEGIRSIFGPDLVSTISLDDYHTLDRKARALQGITPLHPNANNIALLEEHLKQLKAGRTIQKPVYNHTTGTFDPPVPFSPTKIVILEGLHPLLTPALRALIDFSVFVDPDREVKYAWKIHRDVEERGYDKTNVLQEIREREPDYASYVQPQINYADAIISIRPSWYDPDGTKRNLYNVTICQKKSDRTLERISLSFDLFAISSLADQDFLFEFRRIHRGEQPMGALTIDGELHYEVISSLEEAVERETGIHPISLFVGKEYVNATDVIRLLLSWRIINKRITCDEFGCP